MTSRYDYPANPGDGRERIPPGATKRASDRTARPRVRNDYTELDDRHAAGEPAGDTPTGGQSPGGRPPGELRAGGDEHGDSTIGAEPDDT